MDEQVAMNRAAIEIALHGRRLFGPPKPLKPQHRTSSARRCRSLENDGDPGPFSGAGFDFELRFGVLGQGARDESTELAGLRPCLALRQTNPVIGDGDAASVAIDHAVKRYRAAFSSLEAVFERIVSNSFITSPVGIATLIDTG